MLNRHQPARDTANGTLLYRTHPIMKEDDERVYRVMEPANQLAQMQLYRWSRSDQFVETPACGELYDYLIVEPFAEKRLVHGRTVISGNVNFLPSKNHFGRTILNALNYNPRRLKGVTKDNPKACQVYHFHSKLELQFGLEYMICSWLRKFLNETAAPGAERIEGPDMVAEELDILANSSWADYLQVYVEPLQVRRNQFEEPKWKDLLRNKPEQILEIKAVEPKGKLRNLSLRASAQ